jgi:hypothetical protein
VADINSAIVVEAHKIEEAAASGFRGMKAETLLKNPSSYDAALKVFDEVYGDASSFVRDHRGMAEFLQRQIDQDRSENPSIPKITINEGYFGVQPDQDSTAVYFGRGIGK